jgi:hypothetical protein
VEAEARRNGLLRVARKNIKGILFICMYTLYFNCIGRVIIRRLPSEMI